LENPTLGAWRGLKLFQSDSEAFLNSVVSRSEYQEEGGLRVTQLKFVI